jgi:hypothetical protein
MLPVLMDTASTAPGATVSLPAPVAPSAPAPTSPNAAALDRYSRSVSTANRVPMPPQRPKNRVLLVLRWPVSWLLDRHSDLSTSKIMAFAILTAQVFGHPVPTALAALLLSASFGYTMFKDFSTRGTWSVAATDAVSVSATYAKSVSETITKNVQRVLKGRNTERGFDPSKPELDPSGGES